ncbi:MAG: hypothetical protein II661_09665 [Bacteroidales bacterium]|nr:hypothetical protein [Bacteroidales bacterium]
MKKNNKVQSQPSQRFGGKIRQMRQSKMVLVNFTEVKPFIDECAKRGIILGVGSTYGESIVMYEK